MNDYGNKMDSSQENGEIEQGHLLVGIVLEVESRIESDSLVRLEYMKRCQPAP